MERMFLLVFIVIVIFGSIDRCSDKKETVNSGEIRDINYEYCAIGTDSTIIIVSRETGLTVSVINRKSKDQN